MNQLKRIKAAASAWLALCLVLVLAPVGGQQAQAASWEAEAATLLGGAGVATNHAGYSGSGFADGFTDGNKGAAAVQFAVSAAAAGSYTAALRYANGTGSTMTLSLYVNGTKLRGIALPSTGSWDSWGTAVETIALQSGSNTIRYQFDLSDSGNVNLDRLDVEPTAAPPAGMLEAEAATLLGGALAEAEHGGYTGSGYVGGLIDSHKGSAAVQFAATSPEAGDGEAVLRYANGTGSVKTLSLYVNGVKTKQLELPATGGWSSWGTLTETVALQSGANTIRYQFDLADSGNVNLDHLALTLPDGSGPGPGPGPGSGERYEAEDQFYSGSVTSTGTALQTFAATGDRVVFTVRTEEAGAAGATLRYAGGSRTLEVEVNGVAAGTTTLAATGGLDSWGERSETLRLRRGLNTITYRALGSGTGIAVDALTVDTGVPLEARGATVPYQELEAEAGATNAQVLAPDRDYLTVEAESAGRSAVKLTQTGHYVEWTAPQSANALVVRYSMPDAPGGGGTEATLSLYVNGTKRQSLDLSSRYAWTYGAYPYNDDPSGGGAHHFYDESRFLVGAIPAGATVRLQKDGRDQAAYYTIDLIDLEQIDPAYARPPGFVSIADFGAVSGDSGDDTQAIRDAIAHAKAGGAAGVWIPAGRYRMNDRVQVSQIHIRGAGMWHTELLGTGGKGGFYGTGGDVTIADLAISGDAVQRNDATDQAGFEGNFGTGSLIQQVWIEHMKVGMWLQSGTDGLYAVGGRVRNTWADGLNLHGGVQHTTIAHYHVRNTGDDAFAMWSDSAPNANNTFRYNTAQVPVLANTYAIYGGHANKVLDSVGADTVTAGAGIVVSTRFGAVPFTGTTEVKRNTLVRTGGWEPNWSTSFGALWIYAENQDITAPIEVARLELLDSTYEGIKFSYNQTITGITLDRVEINGAGTYGLAFDTVSGSGQFSRVTVTGATSGGLHNPGNQYSIVRGPGNSGW
ncbi:carbohydrate-binding protein [Paenibacillus sp. IB182496]|uniref:Carbohydrate-binding protein n=1 Tax=Paenibacillus sabuli TaxID=2772509 RepID=A0A927BX81_9BACL|nr:carbohydrate-binding protein [Paenibacillus sabuli]MBD2847104.1 carbohydrate-binding protein [Paenibacillus sabuli]